jgi:hypothetical protein
VGVQKTFQVMVKGLSAGFFLHRRKNAFGRNQEGLQHAENQHSVIKKKLDSEERNSNYQYPSTSSSPASKA